MVDPDRGLVLREGEPVHLRAKSFALLACLLRAEGRVVGKDELIAAVWPDVIVTEDSLTQTIRDLRRVLGEGVVRTVARRGYSISVELPAAAPVRAMPLFLKSAAVPPGGAAGLALQDQAVAEIRAALSRFGLVALRNSDDGGFVLQVVVRGSGRDLSLTVQLDAADGRHVWGESLRLPRSTLPDALGAVAYRVASRMLLDTARQGEALPWAERSAVQLMAQGLAAVHGAERPVVTAAIRCLDAAIAADPGLALAHAYRAQARVLEAGFGEDPDPVVEMVLPDARMAVAMQPDEARCLQVLSFLLGWRGDLDGAELAARQALRINPWDADCMAHLGVIVTQRGDPAEGLQMMEAAADLNPLHPQWFHHQFALALYLLGRPAEALAHLEAWSRQSPWRFIRAAACAAALDDVVRARRHLATARALAQGFDPLKEAGDIYGFERPNDKARLLADLAKAQQMER